MKEKLDLYDNYIYLSTHFEKLRRISIPLTQNNNKKTTDHGMEKFFCEGLDSK